MTSKCHNVGMSGKKVSLASASLPLVNRVSLASALQHLKLQQYILKVPKCEILMSWISMIFLS